jgi:hypothetical protein
VVTSTPEKRLQDRDEAVEGVALKRVAGAFEHLDLDVRPAAFEQFGPLGGDDDAAAWSASAKSSGFG